MLAQQVRACVSARPLQPCCGVALQNHGDPQTSPRREREQGRLPRNAARGVTVEVALRHYCHAGGGSRGVDDDDEELDMFLEKS